MNPVAQNTQFNIQILKERFAALRSAGQLREAEEVLEHARQVTPRDDYEMHLRIKLHEAILARDRGQLYDALRLQTEAGFLAARTTDDELIGHHRHGLGITYETIAEKETIPEYFDRALLCYEEAREYYRRARSTRNLASTENCIAFLFLQLGHIEQAFDYSARAINTTRRLDDRPFMAQLQHTRAQIFLRAGDCCSALALASQAAVVLREHKEWLVLPQILKTVELTRAQMLREAGEAVEGQ